MTIPERGYADICLKTTGLFPYQRNRVVEVAVVHLDEDGHTTARWETVVNPSKGGEGSPLRDAAAYLIGFAALAYCRTFFASKVRKLLTKHIVIPAESQDLHWLVGAFRNTTIAHSQSELSTTFPVGILDAGTLRVRDVTAATYSQTLPPPLVSRYLELLEAVDNLLFEAIEPVRQRLVEELGRSDRAAMVARGVRPNVIDALDADFDPRTKRLPYPTANKLHWSSTPLSGE